jgi:hypothetical protein
MLALLLLAGCAPAFILPVDVAAGRLSPPYLVSFVNETGAPFDVLPSERGRSLGQPAVRVPAGGSFEAILQLRRVTVGTGSAVAGAQVMDGAYFEQAGDKAEVHFLQEVRRSALVALHHPSWFEGEAQPGAAPILLVVPMKGFSLRPLFPRGPPGGP